MRLEGFLDAQAQRRPEAPLVIHGDRRATYGEVDEASGRLARLLVEAGLRPGDRVGLLAPNSSRYVVAYYAALKAGAVVVPLHAGTDARTLGRMLRDCAASALLAGPGTGECLASAAADLPDLRMLLLPDGEAEDRVFPPGLHVLEERAAARLDPLPAADRQDEARAMIVYTSGSTGHPRGAVLTHRNLVANTRSILAYLDLGPTDRVSVVLPFPYVYGKSLLNTHVAVGGSLVLHDSLVFPNAVLDVMEREEVTGLSGVPSTFAILLHRSDLAGRSLPALRYVTQAGGGMPVPHVKRLIEALPGKRIVVMYGATEASARLTYVPPEELPRKLGSIGIPIAGVELKVRRDDGSEADPGESGELVARGENIMEGYWGDPTATGEVLDRHGFHTGDLGWRDEDGFFWLAGRKREMIKSGAHRIGPREIEETLLECGQVEQAAVVGRFDELLGEAIVAHVTPRPGATPDAAGLESFCRERLPAHKVPTAFVIRRAFPMSPAGKIDKRALRAEQTEGEAGD